MKIKAKFDRDGYMSEYAEVGGLSGDDVTEVIVPNEYVRKIGKVEYVWDEGRNDFIPNLSIDVTEVLIPEFQNIFMYMKLDNGRLIFDENRKIKIEKQQTSYKVDKMRARIMELEQQKEFYEHKGWDTKNISEEISSIDKELEEMIEEMNKDAKVQQ